MNIIYIPFRPPAQNWISSPSLGHFLSAADPAKVSGNSTFFKVRDPAELSNNDFVKTSMSFVTFPHPVTVNFITSLMVSNSGSFSFHGRHTGKTLEFRGSS